MTHARINDKENKTTKRKQKKNPKKINQFFFSIRQVQPEKGLKTVIVLSSKEDCLIALETSDNCIIIFCNRSNYPLTSLEC